MKTSQTNSSDIADNTALDESELTTPYSPEQNDIAKHINWIFRNELSP